MEQKVMTKTKLIITSLALSLFSCNSDYELTGERPDVNPGDVTDCPFSPISGTKLSAYDCNPVFESTNEDWGGDVGSVGFYATEVMGHPFYQMWYTSSSSDSSLGGGFGMGYAVSANGTTWDTHPNNPLFENDPTSWDKDAMAGQVIVWDHIESQYIMAYQGITLGDGLTDPGVWGVGISTSTDGINWTKSPNNPVINFSEDFDVWNGATISPCWPLTITLNNRGALKGYIAAATVVQEEIIPGYPEFGTTPIPGDECHIYSMTGTDSYTWIIEDSAPVFVATAEYDSKGFAGASVVEIDEVLYMFYIGFNEWTENTGYRSATNMSVNLATSTDDGATWVRDENNPLPVSTTNVVSDVAAQVIGDRIHLWVTDKYDLNQAIGYFLFEPSIDPHQ